MKSELHISPQLLGTKLRSSNGKLYTILAVWLEKSEEDSVSLQLTCLVKDSYGSAFKKHLPDTDMEFYEEE